GGSSGRGESCWVSCASSLKSNARFSPDGASCVSSPKVRLKNSSVGLCAVAGASGPCGSGAGALAVVGASGPPARSGSGGGGGGDAAAAGVGGVDRADGAGGGSGGEVRGGVAAGCSGALNSRGSNENTCPHREHLKVGVPSGRTCSSIR